MGILGFLWPLLAGGGCWWIAGKSRGRNAKSAFQFAAWGFWLLMLFHVRYFFLPISLLWFAPSILCFLLAGSSILKEMRAQKSGEFTDAA